MQYRLDTPYPKVEINSIDLEEAKKILSSYSGEVSENSAIHLYLYQAFSLREKYPHYGTILKNIAIVEMKHLQLLSQVIQLLGLAPAFVYPKEKKLMSWDSDLLNYTVDIEDMMILDIESEINAIQGYQQLINSLQNQSIQKLFRRIIQDEEIHLSIFQNILKEVKKP